ncbi:hypothetical protein CEE44_00795 [Candidatus Woesearchaeota archaeon B3_Woes]|nr:MAG: hypothetical protein CEE44_00795 [Candidatus Woesearchaeota archaeon B3_Woes]
MKWELIAQRENELLKNCLHYESLIEDFVKVFKLPYSDFLTARHGMSYSIYHNKVSSTKIALFVLKKIRKNPDFMKNMHKKGKRYFDNLINFCKDLSNLKVKTNKELLRLIETYFRLYKKPYPYFMITVEARALEKNKEKNVKEAVNLMAKLRLYGRTSFNKTHELALPLFEEIAKRFNTTSYELKFLTPHEIRGLLLGKEIDIKNIIKNRQKCFFIHFNGEFRFLENASLTIEEEVEDVIKGQGAFHGNYKGKVKLIKDISDVNALKKGDVLVTQMTTTDLITDNIKKAGAIITDEGGITCHAAILSREFKIPALIGTKIATKILKDGDIVQIDTKKGIANKI